MKEINLLELFSGTGGFTKGFLDAGYTIKNHYFSEIDKHAIANYKYNFKKSIYYGSVTDVRGKRGEADIITFGSPCQDFSLAGKRAGMEGQRSSLILEAIRLISKIRPSVFIWENVKGTFSSNNGADFWAIISAFANIGSYRLEWQLLNTSWFLPQNRERIYLIGHLDGRSEPRVFPIQSTNQYTFKAQSQTLDTQCNQGVIGYSRDSKGKIINYHEKEIANTLHSSSGSGGNTDQYVYKNKAKDISQTLDTQCNQGVIAGTWRTHKDGEGFRELKGNNSPTIPARAREDGSGQPVIKFKNKALNKTIEENNLKKGEIKALDLYNHKAKDISLTLKEPHHNDLRLYDGYAIRRLTEIECERLQGFPDNWTKYGIYDGQVKEVPKTQRYKMMGNAVTVKVVEEIAKKLKINKQ